MRKRIPLVYFHRIVERKYEAEYPVFIVGDAPESLPAKELRVNNVIRDRT